MNEKEKELLEYVTKVKLLELFEGLGDLIWNIEESGNEDIHKIRLISIIRTAIEGVNKVTQDEPAVIEITFKDGRPRELIQMKKGSVDHAYQRLRDLYFSGVEFECKVVEK